MRKLDREVAVLGSTSVGKSALTMRFVHDQFPTEYDPTIFRRYNMQTTVNGIDYNLVLYDTAGLEQQSQISHSFLKSNGFVLVYSIADAQSFAIVKDIYDRIADELMQENIPVVLVGNKSDLLDKRAVSTSQGLELAKSINARFFETSARTGSNVRDSFLTLLHTIDNHSPSSGGDANDSNRGAPANNNVVIDQQQQQRNQQQQQGNNRPAAANRTSNTTQRPTPQDEKKSNCILS